MPFFSHHDFNQVIPPPQANENGNRLNGFNQQALPIRHSGSHTNGYSNRYGGPSNGPVQAHLYRPQIGGIASSNRGVQSRRMQDDGIKVNNAAEASYFRKDPCGGESYEAITASI